MWCEGSGIYLLLGMCDMTWFSRFACVACRKHTSRTHDRLKEKRVRDSPSTGLDSERLDQLGKNDVIYSLFYEEKRVIDSPSAGLDSERNNICS